MTVDDASPNGTRPLASRDLSVTEAVRRRPLVSFATPVAVVVLAILFVLFVPPLYETSTDIRIDEEQSGVAMLQILETLASGSEVQTEMAVLRSRTLAEEVVRELALQATLARPVRALRSEVFELVEADTSASEATYTFSRSGDGFRVEGEFVLPATDRGPFSRPRKETRDLGAVAPGEPTRFDGLTLRLAEGALEHETLVLEVSTFADAVEDLQERVVVSRPDREADAVRVQYTGGDPEIVQDVANHLARRFIERRQEVQTSEARNTVAFLQEQIDTLEVQLATSEEALRVFREANDIVSLQAEADAQIGRLADLQAQRDVLESQRRSLARLMEEIRQRGEPELTEQGIPEESPYRRLLAFPGLIQNPATAELLSQLGGLETRVSELLVGRTPQDRDVRIFLAGIANLEGQLRDIGETYLASLTDQVESLETTLAAFEEELEGIPATEMTYVRLRREAEIFSELFTLMQTRLKEAEIVASVEDVSVRVIDPAAYPREPVRPKPWLTVGLGVVLGLLLGVSGAVAGEHMDRTIRDRRDLQAVSGASVLGLIPSMDGGRTRLGFSLAGNGRQAGPRLVTGGAGDPVGEAYRALRTNILFSSLDRPPKTIVFTSPMPGDGKSTTASNLALVLAQQGQRVLLVDGDMRRGRLHELFGTAAEPGLSDVLFERASLAEAASRVEPDGAGCELSFLPTGVRPPNPAELIASDRMRSVFDEAEEAFDAVIVDAPPLNLVTDAALLGAYGDGVILVARASVTEEGPFRFALDQLSAVHADLLGVVLNGVEARKQDQYGSAKRGAHAYFDR